MNTKYLMIASSVCMGILGIFTTFLPTEVLNYAELTPTVLPALLIQITGALYLGFSLMNWMAKTALIGGIYSKPLCIGNFLHFTVAGLALLKVSFHNFDLKYVLIVAIIYSVFAILFGLTFFTSPIKNK
ncbi:MAG: hypothetical protein H7319_23210 [Spirosoma sp.]|nr:hypothetical protein [Spirosoma sp.]